MWTKPSLLNLFLKPIQVQVQVQVLKFKFFIDIYIHQMKRNTIHVYHRKNRTWGLSLKLPIDGLVQERRNSIANALELRLSGTNPSRCPCTELSYQRAWARRPYDECKATHEVFEFSLTCHIRVTLLHERHGVSDHRQLDRLFHGLFKLTMKETSKLCITGPLWKNPPMTDGFPSRMANDAESDIKLKPHHE